MTDLFAPIKVGTVDLPNRIIMAPLTRNRATKEGVQGDLNAHYYRQRAGAGLLIAEMTMVSRQGSGYIYVPGMFTDEQVEGWKLTTEAVHDQGGRIFVQLGHTGRVGHTSLNEGKPPVAPSAIQIEGENLIYGGESAPYSTPRALETAEIPEVVAQFASAATRAQEAGFDGIEIHGANGYLLDQFLRSGSNKRTDQYGGSVENRARFPLEVVAAVVDAWESERVGIRLSPLTPFNDMSDDNPMETYRYMAEQLNKFNLAYIHLISYDDEVLTMFRETYKGNIIVCGEFKKESGNDMLASGKADMIAFGTTYIANPDLPVRFKLDAPLNEPNPATFFGGDHTGYTDYPTLSQQ